MKLLRMMIKHCLNVNYESKHLSPTKKGEVGGLPRDPPNQSTLPKGTTVLTSFIRDSQKTWI